MTLRSSVFIAISSLNLAAAIFVLPSQALEVAQNSLEQPAVPASQEVFAQTVVTYPKGYFLESIAIDVDGTIYISENTRGEILRRYADGGGDVFARIEEVGLAGLELDIDGTLIATGHAENGDQYIFQFADDGRIVYQQTFPEAGFFNGIALFQPGVFLIADSNAGTIWKFDTNTQQLSVWLQDNAIAPNPELPNLPAANGIKLFDGAVYVSNSGQATVSRIPIRADGSPGELEVVFSDVILDDFAFSSNGTLYGTTHINDSVITIAPDGQQRTLATEEQGVTGSTDLAFGVLERDRQSIYVVGDGGIFGAESAEDIVAPELVRIPVGELGISQEATLGWLGRPEQVKEIAVQLVQCKTASNTDRLRATIGPQYLRYLEINIDKLSYAGQLYADGRENPPTDRLYFVNSDSTESALNTMQRSPYYRAGVYSTCTASPFSTLIGNTIGGVAWPAEAIFPRE